MLPQAANKAPANTIPTNLIFFFMAFSLIHSNAGLSAENANFLDNALTAHAPLFAPTAPLSRPTRQSRKLRAYTVAKAMPLKVKAYWCVTKP